MGQKDLPPTALLSAAPHSAPAVAQIGKRASEWPTVAPLGNPATLLPAIASCFDIGRTKLECDGLQLGVGTFRNTQARLSTSSSETGTGSQLEIDPCIAWG